MRFVSGRMAVLIPAMTVALAVGDAKILVHGRIAGSVYTLELLDCIESPLGPPAAADEG